HSTVWFVFPAQSFTFEVHGYDVAEAQAARVIESRHMISTAMQRNELHTLAALDPFAEARAREFEGTAEYGLLAREQPVWTRFIWAIAVVSGLVIGVAAWRLRNWQSDERAFARLRSNPDVEAAQAYLAGGGLHVADVKNAILPRAYLNQAKKETGL